MLSAITFLPALTAIVLLLLPRSDARAVRLVSLLGSLLTLALALALCLSFDPSATSRWEERREWVPSLGVSYRLGVDGLSLFLVALTALLAPISIAASWKSVERRVLEFHLALLLLETGMVGAFLALDLVLFYVFWELMLVPMALLIGIWGSRGGVAAAIKFILYTLAGSLLMLFAILALYVHTARVGTPTFDLDGIRRALAEHPLDPGLQMALFLAFGAAFAIKIPLVPLHTWLPDAHTEAPTAGSVILAGVLLKMGAYGFLRFAIPLFPQAAVAATPWVTVISVVGIIFGACMCFVQEDMKRLVAYSSVSHMGFVVLGIFSMNIRGVTGGIIQMVNHGLSTGALFLLVGMLYERRHTRSLREFGGLASVTPQFATAFLITTLSSIGLPALNGFVGEFLILQGAFERGIALAAAAALGLVLGAAYMLVLCRRLLFGEVTAPENKSLTDLDAREVGILVPILLLMVAIGLFSPWFTDRIAPTVASWLAGLPAAGGR